MRELERVLPSQPPVLGHLAIVGQGRLGNALADALTAAGHAPIGPLGRDFAHGGLDGNTAPPDAVLLCVPDAEIAAAAAELPPGPLVGHCSGATALAALAPHEAFSLHPLMTVTVQGAEFHRAGAAVAGSSQRALRYAFALADALGMHGVEIDEHDRPTYHAAASIASNFLITLEAAAERLAASVGVDRGLLVPLVRATVENWAMLGASDALTGPVARGDEETVARQRTAIEERARDLLPLFDALTDATRALVEAPAR